MERAARPSACGALFDRCILRSGLGKVIRMIEWNEHRLKELIRKMGLRRTPGQGKTPIHLSLYRSSFGPEPLLTQVIRLGTTMWLWMGYDKTDWISAIRYLGSLECRTDRALWAAIQHQRLDFELTKLLIDAGCEPSARNDWGWDALVCLALGSHPVDPQVTDLFLSAGCRMDLDGCRSISDETRLRFDQILKEHAEWREKQDRLLTENSPTDFPVDWSR